MTEDITVAFLARGVDGGLDAVEAFFASYDRHPAGAPHFLVILAKGWEGVPGRERLGKMAVAAGAAVLDLPDDGYDWGAYFRLSAIAQTEYLVLLNTHSRILKDNWLALLDAQIKRPGIGLAGCTGSWGTIGWNWVPPIFHIGRRWRNNKRVKAIGFTVWVGLRYLYFLLSHRRHFPSFPNPHIRSNAFILRTTHMREFAGKHKLPNAKHEAHHLECGHDGLSRFIETKGLGLLLCGADGVGHVPSSWPDSDIFCCPDQPNLLVADNVTSDYANRTQRMKRELELVFWGRTLAPFGDEP
jgi:hypothetical protein